MCVVHIFLLILGILYQQGNLGTQTNCRIRRNNSSSSNNNNNNNIIIMLFQKNVVQLGGAQGSPRKLVVGVRVVPHQRNRK
jgi:hypothetical protein